MDEEGRDDLENKVLRARLAEKDPKKEAIAPSVLADVFTS